MAVKVNSTKVLSARVTPDVYSAWQSLAKSQNISVSECVSEYLRDVVTIKSVLNKNMDKTSIDSLIEQLPIRIVNQYQEEIESAKFMYDLEIKQSKEIVKQKIIIEILKAIY
jgi:hypothetical protein